MATKDDNKQVIITADMLLDEDATPIAGMDAIGNKEVTTTNNANLQQTPVETDKTDVVEIPVIPAITADMLLEEAAAIAVAMAPPEVMEELVPAVTAESLLDNEPVTPSVQPIGTQAVQQQETVVPVVRNATGTTVEQPIYGQHTEPFDNTAMHNAQALQKPETKAQKQGRFTWRDIVLVGTYFPMQIIPAVIAIAIVFMRQSGLGASADTAIAQASIYALFTSGFIMFTYVIIAYKEYLWEQLKAFMQHFGRNTLIIVITYFITMVVRILFAMFISDEVAGNQEAIESMIASAGLLQKIALSAPLILFAPFVEEMLMRKVIVGNTFKRNSPVLTWSMVFVSGIAFGMLHFSGETGMAMLQLVPYMIMGWMFAASYAMTKNIFIPIFGHLVSNLIAVISLFFLL